MQTHVNPPHHQLPPKLTLSSTITHTYKVVNKVAPSHISKQDLEQRNIILEILQTLPPTVMLEDQAPWHQLTTSAAKVELSRLEEGLSIAMEAQICVSKAIMLFRRA